MSKPTKNNKTVELQENRDAVEIVMEDLSRALRSAARVQMALKLQAQGVPVIASYTEADRRIP